MEPTNPKPGPKDKTNIPNPQEPYNWEIMRGLSAEHRATYAAEAQALEMERLNFNIEHFTALATHIASSLGIPIPAHLQQTFQTVLPKVVEPPPPPPAQPRVPASYRQPQPAPVEQEVVYAKPDHQAFKKFLQEQGVTSPQELITKTPGR